MDLIHADISTLDHLLFNKVVVTFLNLNVINRLPNSLSELKLVLLFKLDVISQFDKLNQCLSDVVLLVFRCNLLFNFFIDHLLFHTSLSLFTKVLLILLTAYLLHV